MASLDPLAPSVSAASDSVGSSDDDGAATVSSTTTGRDNKRKRHSLNKTSCELCKLRKVKCDRAEPACGWCAKNKRECIYRERARPGSRTYGADLEAKVNRLDAMLRLLGRRVEDHITSTTHTPSQSQSPGPGITPTPGRGASGSTAGEISTPGSIASSHPSTMMDIFSVDLGSLSGFRDSPQQRRPLERSSVSVSGQSMASLSPSNINRPSPLPGSSLPAPPPPPPPPPPLQSPQQQQQQQQNQQNQQNQQQQVQTPTASYTVPLMGEAALVSDPDLPEPEIVYTLVDLYFKHVNTWCPILDRKAAFAAFFGSTMLSESKRILLHAVIVTTLRFYKDPRLSAERKAQYHRTSKQRVEHYALEHVSLEALEALVILALDVLGTSNGPLGWNLLAMIVRTVIQLDLCTESSVYLTAETTPRTGTIRRVVLPQPTSWIEDEGRRRLCWMVYILDRYATVATPFDFMLDDKFLDLALPCRYDLFSGNVPVQTRSLSWADSRRAMGANMIGMGGMGGMGGMNSATGLGMGMAMGPALGNSLGLGESPASTSSGGGGSSSSPSSATQPPVNNPQNLGSFSYHCEVLRILSRVHNFLRVPLDVTSPRAVQTWRSTFRALDGELNSWLHTLPGEYGAISQLCHSDPASRVANWIMLHAAFVTAVLRLHSTAAYPTPTARPSAMSPFSLFSPSHIAAQRCLGAVRSLRDIAADVLDTNGLDLLGPPFAFALWSSARALIAHAAVYDATVVDGVMDFFIDTLRQMGTYWEVAATYARILTDIVAEGRRSEPSFSEMRRVACEIVDLAARQRRSTLESTTTRLTTSRELDYVDIFDFFNYPRVASLPVAPSPYMAIDKGTATPDRVSADFAFEAQKHDVDWLSFQPPHE